MIKVKIKKKPKKLKIQSLTTNFKDGLINNHSSKVKNLDVFYPKNKGKMSNISFKY